MPETYRMVSQSYESEHISWQCPGRKDNVSVFKRGEKMKVQKKILLSTVMEAYQQFKKENPDVKIGKSLFASLRPSHILPVSDKDHNVCCCKYHENLELLGQGLKTLIPALPDTKTLLNMTVCDPDNVEFNLGDCARCDPAVALLAAHFFQSELSCFIYQWNDKHRKEISEMSISTAQTEWIYQLKQLRGHAFIAKVQLQKKKHFAESLQSNKIILHEDFSENFAIKQQNEIMAAHWDKHGATVFTAVLTTDTRCHSYAVISDENRHYKFSVVTFNKAILNHATTQGVVIDKFHFFSDGAGSQFKNRFTLPTLVDTSFIHSDIKAAYWNFFATAHGKGACDGVGATVKRAVWRRILKKKSHSKFIQGLC
ncbi:(S)-beta-bisabolene synthase [Elysia marginata]|uniref:(S)-beta-bisabolene synthase n=1 Tax=Elysia marginata TaxID=1093978 RepID=A0AAV4G737_9GAST|nr:(S)-beta-bisabolene synthase [Elysia marginata]